MKLSTQSLSYYAMLDICVAHNRLDPEQVMEDYPKINFDNMTEIQFKEFLKENYCSCAVPKFTSPTEEEFNAAYFPEPEKECV